MDVVVAVGGWEHECCGQAIERDQLVDLRCIRDTGPDGHVRLIESHHGGLDAAADERVQGRVSDLHLVQQGGTKRAVLRVPSGLALRGLDDADDGHLEDPWTGEVVPAARPLFLVTVRTSRR
jgi:hypothetical protein